MSCVQQEQSTSEEYDPFHMVRSFHRRQRELITQSPIPSTPSPETGGKRQAHTSSYSGFMQETPKPQRERREKHRTAQNSVRNPVAEPLDKILYIQRDSQSMRGQNMQLPLVGQDSKICGNPLTSSRKNTPERFHNELDVNLEVARRVELELRKWQRESGPKGKPPLPQSRKQQTMKSQQYLSQEPVHSQDIRVQMA